ncbi:MAG: glycoside hydrolase family 2 TIM barrel-domain containing protein [Rikenellaceae bacterium]
MKRLFLILTLSLSTFFSEVATAQNLPNGYPQTERTKLLLNSEWKFFLGDADAPYYSVKTDDSRWESVTVPHTFCLTDLTINGSQDDKSQKSFMRDVGWYRRDIFIGNSNKKVYLEFEGVHQITTLWVNGKKVGVHSVGGYTPFNFDITDYVKRGATNQITILADNRVSQVTPPDPGQFDYIKFSGLYRDLYLVEKSLTHITSNLESMYSGVTITTPSVDYVNGNATIDIRTEVKNESNKAQKTTLVQRVVDADGSVVLKLSQSAEIGAGDSYRFSQIGGIDRDVKLWSIETPYLYKVNTTLYDESGKAIDVVDNRLGLRKIEYDYEKGIILNGKNIELIGLNRHQQFAYIGDAVPNSLHYRDMIQFKNLGLNCVRTAHYPHDDEIIKACDELGILVYEEAPTWISISPEQQWYENEQKANQAMVRNHKNSPSIIIWGAGINHRGAVAQSQFVVKQEDPTRWTASQNSRWTGWQTSNWADIFANMNYGPGIWAREEPLLAMEGNAGPEATAIYKRDPKMPGIFAWTAHAYYTFHVFDMDNSMEIRTRLGLMDAFRYPKDDCLYWYPAELKTEPYIHVKDSWTSELKMLTIYSNATEIELLVNGESIGRYAPSKRLIFNGLEHAPFEIENFKYSDGELKVIAYREGRVILEKSVYTLSKAEKLRLVADKYDVDFTADGNDILVVHAEVLDKNGMVIKDYEGEIKYSVKGDATIVGDEIGKGYNPAKVINGVGSALIRAGRSAGEVEISANSSGLASSSIVVETSKAQTDMMVADAYAIRDKEGVVVDLGGEGQLIQFGWTPWISEKQSSATISIAPATPQNYVAGFVPSTTDRSQIVESGTEGAYTFTIKCNSSDGVIRWLGEMNVIGHDSFVYGDGLLATDKNGVDLEISGLKKGDYSLTTYHHAPSSNTNEMDPNLDRLKNESIHKLPYAKEISVSVNGKKEPSTTQVTSGKEQQYSKAATYTLDFTVENDGDIATITFRSEDNNNGIWLNGFEFFRYLK